MTIINERDTIKILTDMYNITLRWEMNGFEQDVHKYLSVDVQKFTVIRTF